MSHSTTGLPYEAVIFYVICLILSFYQKESKELKSCKSRDAIINSFWSCIGGKRIDTWYFWSVRNFPDANAWDGLNFLGHRNSTQY
jgi:hypothetical protein